MQQKRSATSKKRYQARRVERVVKNWLQRGGSLFHLKTQLSQCCCHKERPVPS